ncbi:hypothetical protein QAD02_004665 [Eretmocerus hayati]|uniref:Uncharacterized protein n=1 Tax=Eretmocerus hayati TaxID=131215 RepID=A0ACC2NQE3_9HYME|nr:hypothetical protein QAD02_004665 [Eretmocerus hayati]
MNLQCVITIGANDDVSVQWSTPQNSSSLKISLPQRRSAGVGEEKVYSELFEENLTLDHRGEYICRIKSRNNSYETKAYIYVHEPEVYYLELTSSNKSFVVESGKSVEFSANVSGHRKPEIRWYHPDGSGIIRSSKFHIQHFISKTTLNITNVTVQDIGTFSLEVSNWEKVLNFSLLVIGLDVELKIQPNYTFKENATLLCQVQGYPLANITWFRTKCLHHSHGDCSVAELKSIGGVKK